MTYVWQPKLYVSVGVAPVRHLYSVRSPSTTTPSIWTITTPCRYVRIHPRPALAHTPRCKDPAQITASVHPLRVRVASPTDCTRSPRLYIRAHILLFNVCSPIFTSGILGTHVSFTQPSKRQYPYPGRCSRVTREHPRRFRCGCPFL